MPVPHDHALGAETRLLCAVLYPEGGGGGCFQKWKAGSLTVLAEAAGLEGRKWVPTVTVQCGNRTGLSPWVKHRQHGNSPAPGPFLSWWGEGAGSKDQLISATENLRITD